MSIIRIAALTFAAAATAFSIHASAQQTAKLSQQDQNFLENAIQGSYAEIDGSKLALEKSSRPDVKDFANTMIDDHAKMAKDATSLAQAKGYTPPDGPSVIQKAEVTALKTLSGKAFDTMYVNRIGIAAHETTVKEFEHASQQVHDSDVKAMITKTLPKLREHLQMARTLNMKQDTQ